MGVPGLFVSGRGWPSLIAPSPANSPAPHSVNHRVVYAETVATGEGVTETRNKKATAEFLGLWSYLKGILNG